jgi:uncharacterized protein (DUF849 family)
MLSKVIAAAAMAAMVAGAAVAKTRHHHVRRPAPEHRPRSPVDPRRASTRNRFWEA